ncbi:MAG: radical SAM protein [Desulfuromonadaceae bacterium]|nr:radical SAM protein [Desulfuromonadaceae bacterium]
MIPLGLASLAAVAQQAGYSVHVVDAWAEDLWDTQRLSAELRKHPAPLVTGVTVLTPNLRGAKDAIRTARAIFPETLLIIGGPHVSALPKEVLQEFPDADLGVYGEGEITLREVLEAVRKTGKKPEGLPGTIWRNAGNRAIVKAEPRPTIIDMDSLPRPARELFPLDRYHPHPPYGRRWRYMNEITSRGCPFRCAYCTKSVFGNTYRAFSPSRVVADIAELVKKYQVREIHFYDDDLTLNRARTVEIMEGLIAARLDMIWSCTTRCDLVDAELLRLMKKAGCWMISYGVESGNEALRNTVDKGVTLEQTIDAFRETKRSGIKVTGYFMVGLPGETEETVQETMRFMDRLAPDYVNWGVMTVYPGSQFYADVQCGKYGSGKLVQSALAESGQSSPFQDALLYGFEGALSRRRMEELSRLAIRHFYLKPRNIVRILIDIRSFSQLRHTVQTAWNLLRWLTSGMRMLAKL